MLNQIITYLLDKIIGKYVDNFSTLNVRTGILKGDIQLENLPLKQNVLQDLFEWPIIVKSGIVGRVTLRIPYTRFRSQAWAIMIEDIYIVAQPSGNWQCPVTDFKKENMMKKFFLDSSEAKWRKKTKLEVDNGKAESKIWFSYVASLGYQILRNIQIEVRNVHIRYEDDMTIPSQLFSTGLIIDGFSTKSSDFDWESRGELKSDLDVVNKQVDLSGVSVYLDSNFHQTYSDVTSDNIKTILQQKVLKMSPSDYIVKPISFQGIMKRYINPLPMNIQPRISLHLQMKLVEVSLSQAQYKTAMTLSDEIDRFDRQKHHIKYRPTQSVKEAPREWWKFAINEHIRDVCKGTALRERSRNLVKYVQSYENYLLNKDNNDELSFRNQMELDIELDGLIQLREVAMERASRKNRELVQNAVSIEVPQQSSWWDYLWGRRSKDATDSLTQQTQVVSETSQIIEQLLPEETNSIYQGLEQDISDMLNEVDFEAVNFFTRDRIFLRGEFSLEGIRLQLLKDNDAAIVVVNASHLNVGFESRPQHSSWLMRVGLGSLLIQDLEFDNKKTIFRDIVSSMKHNKNNEKEIFALAFESNPLPNKYPANIKRILAINSEPLTIIHSPTLISNVQNFFSNLESTKDIITAAEKQFMKAKARTSASIRKLLNRGSTEIRWWVSLNISAPKIIVPNNRQMPTLNPNCVLLDLGRLHVSNCPNGKLACLLRTVDSNALGYESDVESEDFVTPATSPMGSIEDLTTIANTTQQEYDTLDSTMVELSNIYDVYSIMLENTMALVGSWSELEIVLSKKSISKTTDLLLMEPFNLNLDLKRKCGIDRSGQFPNLVLESTLSKLLINISDQKLVSAKGCFQSLINQTDNSPKIDKCPVRHRRSTKMEAIDTEASQQSFKYVSVSFVLQSFIVQLESHGLPLAELSLTGAQFELSRYSSMTLINIHLMNLVLADARANLGPKLDFILASHKGVRIDKSVARYSDDPIIEFSYQIMLKSGCNSSQRKAKLMFSDLDVIANQETLIELLSFMRPIISDGSVIQPDSKTDVAEDEKPSDVLDVTVNCKIVSILLIKISPNFDVENRSAESVGKILLSHMNLNVCKNGSYLSANVRIRNVNVEDISTPESVHRKILTLTTETSGTNLKVGPSEDIINISITQEFHGSPWLISGTMPHIIYVHSPQFIYSVGKCISEFQTYLDRLKDNIAAAARMAILSSPKNDDTDFLNSTRLRLKMLSPILVLPQNKGSNEIILVNLGDIELSNNTVVFEVVFTDAIVMSKELSIVDGEYDIGICTDNQSKFPLLDRIDLHLKISKVVDNPMLLIQCEFSSSLSLSFSKPVYEQVLKSLDNLVYDDDDKYDMTASQIEQFVLSEESSNDFFQNELPITLVSKLSQIKMEIYTDSFEKCEDPMLRLVLQGISFEFIRQNKYIKDIELVIDQISMYQILDFRQQRIQKLLIHSLSSNSMYCDLHEKSASCPNFGDEPDLFGSHSSASSLQLSHKLSKRKKSNSNNEPSVSTMSNCSSKPSNNRTISRPDKLVKINIRLIDKKIPKFSSEYQSVNRFVTANFNQLTFRISMEAWVILLDFFGLGSKFYDPKDIKDLSDVSKVLPSFNRRYDGEIEEIINTRLNIHLNRFSLILENETLYSNHSNLAGLSAVDFHLETLSKDGNMSVSGHLNDFQIVDLSPTGSVYNQRLFPASNQVRALEFEIFKYGLPDYGLIREEDIKLVFKVSSPIVYIHTQRFLQELNQFFQNFLQYQDRLSHLRVTSAGRIVDKSAQRSSRIRMHVSCQAPWVLLPVSAFSDHMLVIDLGKCSLTNEFYYANNDPTLCLLDEMQIDLQEMDIYSAIRIDNNNNIVDDNKTNLVFPCLTIQPIHPKPLSQKCNIHLIVSRNLNCNTSHTSPDWQLSGDLSSVVCSLSIDQYRTIRGVLAHNLGENVDHLKSYKFQAFQVDPVLYTDLTGIAWLAMKMELCLKDVQLNLTSQYKDDDTSFTLCRLNFFQSKLLFHSYSDSSKIVTLACQQITVEDLRYVSCPANNRLNIFQTIISPDKNSANNQSSKDNSQLHLSYSSNANKNNIVIQLNKMKAITIFDWLHVTKNWIFTPPYDAVSLAIDNDNQFDKYIAFYIQSKPQSRPAHLSQVETMRKHYQEIIQEEFKPTQLTFDVQESRFFILEDSSHLHTHALILILAGTCSYQTRENRPGPFSFSLSQFHLASCSMSSDTSNLLSIINPVEIRIKSEEKLFISHGKPSLDDVLHDKDSTKLGINVEVSAFKIRLSFTDMQLLAKIMHSFQNQTTPPANVAFQTGPSRNRWNSLNMDGQNAIRSSQPSLSPFQRLSKFVDRISIHHLEKNEFVSVCLIDDCIDADVPLFDIKLNNVTIDLELGVSRGMINALLSLEYYNINSFGWTPVIEPWSLNLKWFWQNTFQFYLKSDETLNVDISSHLLQISKNTHRKWKAELQQKHAFSIDYRKRHHNLFVPFIIVNELGCSINYRKLSLNNPPMYDEVWSNGAHKGPQHWIHVPDSTPNPLFFDMETTARDKIRYDSFGSHFNTSHRIELMIDGWGHCQPITVDKLGIFYRHLQRISNSALDSNSDYMRIVIEIVRQGSVQNKIIIRSPLQLTNSLNIPLEVKFSQKSSLRANRRTVLNAQSTMPIPLFSEFDDIQVRPVTPDLDQPLSPTNVNCLLEYPLDFSNNLFSWCTAGHRFEDEINCQISKNVDNKKKKVYLICTVERLNFPLTPKFLPGHIITISAPLSIENRLPCDLRFAMKSEPMDNGAVMFNKGLIRPSGQCTVLTSSMRQSTYFSVYLDSFPRCDPLLIHGYVKLCNVVLIRLYDDQNRLLELEVKVESRPCGPVSIIISALYWIVNRTSLPLLYAQSSEIETLAAGHVPENEEAYSSMPFPFNFSNKNDSFTFRVRLGTKAKLSNLDAFKPIWSEKVSLEKLGTTTIQLRAASLDQNRPHLLYNIGLEIRPGRGKHSNTKMVILTARYLLDNRSSYPLYFVQHNCRNDQNPPIMALPDSFLTFHWPRDDLDQLLAIQKLDNRHQIISKISSGFQIDRCNSFHIYLRGENNYPASQLRVTISLQGARYRVVFTDVDDLPSPYKLDNQTDLQVFFYQNVTEFSCRKHSVLPPKSCITYALDEPTLPPIINLCIESGTQASYDINTVGLGHNLYYDNFLFIVINNNYDNNNNNSPLVFDVPQNSKKVFLNNKCSVSRSQLWYYSPQCELFHEGSIAPHDPKQKLDRSAENHLLLDVDILAPCPSNSKKQMYRMILAKADPRRDKYQRWYFSEDGCLTNRMRMKCYLNASCKNAAVFGGFESFDLYYPPNISQYWLRPGCGEVVVNVVTEGPTRVVRLVDKSDYKAQHEPLTRCRDAIDSQKSPSIEMTIDIKGFGLFLINHLPEELLYAVCNNIHIVWSRKDNKDNLHVKITQLQIDNQQLDSIFPCVMFEKSKTESSSKCAFCLRFERELGHPYDVCVFSYIKMHIVPMCVTLEEKMLLKTIQMFWSPSKEAELLEEDFSSLQHQSHFHDGRKIYIGNLRLNTGTISLSVITAESLPTDLKQMKRLLPSLMSFTNAQITIDPYDVNHVFETSNFIAEAIALHYRNQLRSQAIKIFGSVDFLGNPIGLISDITTGMRSMYSDRDVYNMVKHFAHGIGDSTAKICSSASRVISEITMDPEYEERRQKLFESARISGSNTAQVTAGFKGLAFGIMGGLKSVPSQLDKSYKDEGPSGLFMGALKGIVGVVTKPVGGMLDLATGSATSFREIARSSKEGQPPRRHEPRCLSSSWKLLPFCTTYSNNLRRAPLSDLTQAQKLLARFSVSSKSTETVVGFLVIQNSQESQLKVIVSDTSIHIIKTVHGESNLLKCYPLLNLSTPPINVQSKPVLSGDNMVHINFNYLPNPSEYQTVLKPTFRCDSIILAEQLVKLVCEAHCDYLERQMTYNSLC